MVFRTALTLFVLFLLSATSFAEDCATIQASQEVATFRASNAETALAQSLVAIKAKDSEIANLNIEIEKLKPKTETQQ